MKLTYDDYEQWAYSKGITSIAGGLWLRWAPNSRLAEYATQQECLEAHYERWANGQGRAMPSILRFFADLDKEWMPQAIEVLGENYFA